MNEYTTYVLSINIIFLLKLFVIKVYNNFFIFQIKQIIDNDLIIQIRVNLALEILLVDMYTRT